MNKLIIVGFVWCAGVATCGWSQEIKVTTTGVEVGAAGSSASGSLMQQSGQTTSFVTKDGVNPPEVRMVIKPDGKVGVGTSAPTEKLEVAGNIKVGGAVLSPSGAAPIFGCRAWVNFDGTRDAAGVVNASNTGRYIRGSGNVTSVIKTGTGSYVINFTVPMQDDNYAFFISSDINGVYQKSWQSIVQYGSKTAGSISVFARGDAPSGDVNDKPEISVSIFR